MGPLEETSVIELNALLKGKRVPVGTVHNGMKKVAEGKWEPVKEGSGNAPAADEGEAKHHSEEATRHMGEAAKYMELHRKLEDKIADRKKIDPSYEPPQTVTEMMEEAKLKAKAHGLDYKTKKKHTDDAQLDVEAKAQKDAVKETKTKAAEKAKNQKLEEAAGPKKEAKKSYNNLNDILKGKLAIAMQDHEKHEQYQADKLKYGTTPNPRPEVEKGGPGSGKRSHAQSLKGSAADLKQSYENWKARCEKDPEDTQAQAMKELIADKIRSFIKENNLTKPMVKSLMQLDAGTGTAIDTADYSISEAAAKDWLESFQSTMANYNYGDAPRELDLSRGYSIMMSKVDDGLYSGYIRQRLDRDGAPLEENVAKVDKQTLADIIQYCKAREYIMPEKSMMDMAGDGLASSEMGAEDVMYDGSSMEMGMEAPQAVEDADFDRPEPPMALNKEGSPTEPSYPDKRLEFMRLLNVMLDRI